MVDRAFQKEINNMQINCVECNWNGKYIDYKSHFKTHEKIVCQHCRTTFANNELLKNHLDEKSGNCEQQPMQCKYTNIGCSSETKLNRKLLNDHINSNVAQHLQLVYDDIEPRLRRVENMHQMKSEFNKLKR